MFRNKVESYLAIKYGMTLDQSSAQDYLSIDGDVLYAATSSHGGYLNDIAGIGQHDTCRLTQTDSRSINSDSILTVSSPSDMQNEEFLLWGNDDGSIAAWTDTNAPADYQRVERTWRFDEQGDIGLITAEVDTGNLPTLSAGNSNYYLLLDSDTDFTSGATIYKMDDIGGGVFERTGIEPGGDKYFTFVQRDPHPCGAGTMSTTDTGTTSVLHADIDGGGSFTSTTLGTRNYNVRIDPNTGKRYIASYNNNHIVETDPDGSNASVLYTTTGSAFAMTIDTINSNIYWSTYANGATTSDDIYCAPLDGSQTPIIVESGLYRVSGMDFDRETGEIYWIEPQINPGRIKKATAPNTLCCFIKCYNSAFSR